MSMGSESLEFGFGPSSAREAFRVVAFRVGYRLSLGFAKGVKSENVPTVAGGKAGRY